METAKIKVMTVGEGRQMKANGKMEEKIAYHYCSLQKLKYLGSI